ncbi:MAG TPA: arginyltransferase [Tepidisphaeraceae bacterium]
MNLFAPIAPPIDVRLTVLPDVPCPYLPGETETLRAVMASGVDGETYRAFMDAGFRRSGKMLYQPVCRSCRACVPLRVPVGTFSPGASQRRCWRRNADLRVTTDRPRLSDEKFTLYSRYVHDWHAKPEEANREALQGFLYDSPTDTIEFEYRDPAGRLLGVGICDRSRQSLSSVYFYFDPREARRGLGTFGALVELDYCRRLAIDYYYLGYFVEGCGAMNYKATFRPHELLDISGTWVRA